MSMEESWAAVDPLGEALHFLRMSGIFYSRSELTAPWGLALPAMQGTLMFHVVTAGRCWLQVEGAADRLLQPGDLALVPHGQGHRLASEPGVAGARLFDLPREYAGERYEVIRHGGGGAATSIVCGAVRFDHPAARRLVEVLPKVICVAGADSLQAEWLPSTLRLMAAEARALRPGGEAVVTRLADILVIQAIRAWLEHDPAAQTGWLGALRDRQIGRAITLIHRHPGRAWTVAGLAREVAMSRSAFAARFSALVGEPPMHYVTRWRMHVGLTQLQEEGANLAELAERLGYQSEAAFSRAFRRFLGVSPGAARRERLPERAGAAPRRPRRAAD
jgi:AraC-like DNA-binding protein